MIETYNLKVGGAGNNIIPRNNILFINLKCN